MNTGAGFGATDWLSLFGHFLMLSVLAIGGALATAPDMHRYLVDQKDWLDDASFTSSIAIAQAAPGPNLMFVAVLGWNVAGLAGAFVSMVGMLMPSTLLTLTVSRWAGRHREDRGVRAFSAGMAPLTIGLLLATGAVVARPLVGHPGALLLIAGTTLLMLRTRIGPVWLVAVGAIAGAFGGA